MTLWSLHHLRIPAPGFAAKMAAALLLLAATIAGARAADKLICVAGDGTGDFKTIQAAVDSIPEQNADIFVIELAPGRYAERVTVPRGKNFLTLRGMGRSRQDVVLTDGAGKRGVLSVSADDFRAENFTVENTAGPAAGPQMALFCDGKRQGFENVLVKGWQDTLGSWNGNLAYFHNCEVWGSVDFIYSGGTALFDHCDIVEIRDVGGPLTAPSTPKGVPFGLVFLNCNLKKAAGVARNSSSLMRPWREDGHTAFINCVMDDHLTAKGWSEWDGREQTCRAVEFGSRTADGAVIDLARRAAWVKVLSADEAKEYSITNVLNGWNPTSPPGRNHLPARTD
jgi:pectinesterase